MSDDEEYRNAMEIQRRNFEAQFGSIENLGYQDKTKIESESSDSSDEMDTKNVSMKSRQANDDEFDIELDDIASDEVRDSSDDGYDDKGEKYDGDDYSDDDDDDKPKVFKLGDDYSTPTNVVSSKQEKKLLKLGRAPTLKEIEKKQKELLEISKKQARKSSPEDGDNLENDMKLQRLLQESHILSNKLQYSGAELTMQTLDYEDPTGNARKRVLDSRIRKLASVNSSTGGLPKKLEKMPMSMRKGMINSREQKIAKYEKEARDAGIVLSKVKKGELRNLDAGRGYTAASDRLGVGKKVKQRIRDRGLKIHGVGKSTRNGLVISKEDIERINRGPKRKRK